MDPLSNLTNIRADTIELWDAPTKKYVGIQEVVLGIPPASMDTLEKVASAIGNDPAFFETIAADLDSKADLSLVTTSLAGKADLTTTTNELATKATTSSVTDLTGRVDITELGVVALNTRIDGVEDDTFNVTTELTTNLATKATSSSVTALTARVEVTELGVAALGTTQGTLQTILSELEASPFFSTGTFGPAGGILASRGVPFTVTRESLGVYLVQFQSAHPAGVHYTISQAVQGSPTWGAYLTTGFERIDASSFRFLVRSNNATKVDAECVFIVVN